MKLKLNVEININGAMQYDIVKNRLELVKNSLECFMEFSEITSIRNIKCSITEEGFDQDELKEKEAAIYIGIPYKKLRELRQMGKSPNFVKKGRSYYYSKKDLEPYREMSWIDTVLSLENSMRV